MKSTTPALPMALTAALAAFLTTPAMAEQPPQGNQPPQPEQPERSQQEKENGTGGDVGQPVTAPEQKQAADAPKQQPGGATDVGQPPPEQQKGPTDVGQQPPDEKKDKGPVETVMDIFKDQEVTPGEIVDSVAQARRELWINVHLSALRSLDDDFERLRERVNVLSSPTKDDMVKDLNRLHTQQQEIIKGLQALDTADARNWDGRSSDLNRQVDYLEEDLDVFKDRVNIAYRRQQEK